MRSVRRLTHEHGVELFVVAVVGGVLVLVALLIYAMSL